MYKELQQIKKIIGMEPSGRKRGKNRNRQHSEGDPQVGHKCVKGAPAHQ